MGILFGTGFEYGTIAMFNKSGVETPAIDTTSPKTGNYAVEIRGGGSQGWMDFPTITGSTNDNEIYLAFWMHPHQALGDEYSRAYVYLSDGQTLSIRRRSDDRWDLYVGASNVAQGVIDTPDSWHHVELHVIVDDVAGLIESRIDGVSDASFSGDTKPGTSASFNGGKVRMTGNTSDWWVDDVIYRDDNWSGGIRFERLVPNGDNSVQWEPSSGGTNYVLVDEVPPSDSDYVRASGTAFKDKYDLTDWDGTNKSPVYLQFLFRAQKEVTDGSTVKILVDDGVEGAGNEFALLTSYAYYFYGREDRPSGGAWDENTIDNLLIGFESTIP